MFSAETIKNIVTDTFIGGTKWLHRVRPCKTDACCVERLRSCGAILVGKTNMHELGAGTSGINPHYGYYTNQWIGISHNQSNIWKNFSYRIIPISVTIFIPGHLGIPMTQGGSRAVPQAGLLLWWLQDCALLRLGSMVEVNQEIVSSFFKWMSDSCKCTISLLYVIPSVNNSPISYFP